MHAGIPHSLTCMHMCTHMPQVLSAAGAVNHEELVKLAAEAFGSVPDEEPSSSVRSLLVKVSGGAAAGGVAWGQGCSRSSNGSRDSWGGAHVHSSGWASKWWTLGDLAQRVPGHVGQGHQGGSKLCRQQLRGGSWCAAAAPEEQTAGVQNLEHEHCRAKLDYQAEAEAAQQAVASCSWAVLGGWRQSCNGPSQATAGLVPAGDSWRPVCLWSSLRTGGLTWKDVTPPCPCFTLLLLTTLALYFP